MDRTADGILEYLIGLLEDYLTELNDMGEEEPFFYGEKHAYIECLEIIQKWEHADKFGLTYNVEKRFPI